jgi:mRNA interferase RelE/StbE
MNLYRLEIPRVVQRQIDALPGRYRQRVKRILIALTADPRPSGAEPLRGEPNRYKIRLDHYLIAYRIEDEVLLIEVLKVGPKFGPEFYTNI